MAKPTLGTLLRHLIELLDDDVEAAYLRSKLSYRPRFTPVVKALIASGPSSIAAISLEAGITHSAVSQTVAQMSKLRLVRLTAGRDARERIVALTARGQKMVPKLKAQWQATNLAAAMLDRELPTPLSDVLTLAIEALNRKPFLQRIDEAAAEVCP